MKVDLVYFLSFHSLCSSYLFVYSTCPILFVLYLTISRYTFMLHLTIQPRLYHLIPLSLILDCPFIFLLIDLIDYPTNVPRIAFTRLWLSSHFLFFLDLLDLASFSHLISSSHLSVVSFASVATINSTSSILWRHVQ